MKIQEKDWEKCRKDSDHGRVFTVRTRHFNAESGYCS